MRKSLKTLGLLVLALLCWGLVVWFWWGIAPGLIFIAFVFQFVLTCGIVMMGSILISEIVEWYKLRKI